MDLYVDLDKLEDESEVITEIVSSFYHLNGVEAPDSSELRGAALEAYVNESVEMSKLIEDYMWLLTEDMGKVRDMFLNLYVANQNAAKSIDSNS